MGSFKEWHALDICHQAQFLGTLMIEEIQFNFLCRIQSYYNIIMKICILHDPRKAGLEPQIKIKQERPKF